MENLRSRDTAFFFHEKEGEYSFSINIDYLSNQFEEEEEVISKAKGFIS